MCLGCNRAWTVLHVLWSAIYVICGAAQLIAGIFFFISIPSLHLSSNLWAGTWNIFMGIGVGMLACFARVSSRRQEFLLYMAASILIVNAVNAVMSEWAYYVTDMKALLGAHRYVILIEYACLATRLAASVVILTSFLDTQFAFCSMQSVPKRSSDTKKRRNATGGSSQEQVTDIEYIIPRRKNSKPQTTILNAYSQSWVYDADVVTAPPNNHTEPSPYLKIPQEVTPISRRRSLPQDHSDTTHLIDNPVVHIEEASDDSNSNSDRKLCYMKSFSRATSPAILSPSSSQVSLNNPVNPPIYECLQKLTEPEIYRTRLNSALSDKSDKYQAPQAMRSPKVEKVQYASLMKELQKAIVNKKETTSPPSSSSDKTQSSSKSKSSDAEFSKELEAALQLIQDLESPNTIETPSEPGCGGGVWRNGDEEEKTLSAGDSPISDQQQPQLMTSFKPLNGKQVQVLIRNGESQSTSGYGSPTHKTPDWSTTSSINSEKHLSYTIHNTKSSAVISLYADESPKAKNITLVSITGDDIESCPHSTVIHNENIPLEEVKSAIEIERRSSGNGTNLWNVKSLLRKKKGFPKMCPELEEAIIKSESLAYLSENELLERHQRSKDIQREIEQRVLQQLGTPRSESQC